MILHSVAEFIDNNAVFEDLSVNYWYRGYCAQTGQVLQLPRTGFVEAIAIGLMQQLAKDEMSDREGKMYGVLLVELPNGERRLLKAFSGLLNGCSAMEGWVPPIPGREEVALEEARTLAELENIKQEIISLKQLPERQEYEKLIGEFQQQLQEMSDRHRDRKQKRQEKRQIISENLAGEALINAIEELDEESRLDGIERRKFKQKQNSIWQPIKEAIAQADTRIRELKQRRKELSRQLQTQMHAAYSLTNFFGQSRSLQDLMPAGSMPTGTGDCCAPKLLHYAAAHNLKPLAMAEFWWGLSSSNGDKIAGKFYGSCAERCQPLMGFLLSGLAAKKIETEISGLSFWDEKTPIIYADKWVIAVNKPAGLLSVPGRYLDRQDSVLSRLRVMLPDGIMLASVHRLDEETSGILLVARDRKTYGQLSQQFQQRQVGKVYEGILSDYLAIEEGSIELPLWGDPENRPYQKVNQKYGKPSLTHFRVMAREGKYTRVEFFPITGRTHQIRVHAADAKGLGIPILGDRLYGCGEVVSRLHLHARELSFQHPRSGKIIDLQTETPF